MDAQKLKSQLLGALLLKKRAVTPRRLEAALLEQMETGQPLGHILLAHRWVKPNLLLETLHEQTRRSSVDLDRVCPNPQALEVFDRWFAWECMALPLELLESDPPVIALAMAPPVDPDLIKRIERKTRCRVKALSAPEARVRQELERHYPREIVLNGIDAGRSAENEFVVFDRGETRRIRLDRRSSLRPDIDFVL